MTPVFNYVTMVTDYKNEQVVCNVYQELLENLTLGAHTNKISYFNPKHILFWGMHFRQIFIS